MGPSYRTRFRRVKALARGLCGCDFPTMRLRIATLEDSDAVASVLRPSYALLMAGAYPPDLLARTLPAITRANPDLLRSGRYYLVETETGEPAGCGGWSIRPAAPTTNRNGPISATSRRTPPGRGAEWDV